MLQSSNMTWSSTWKLAVLAAVTVIDLCLAQGPPSEDITARFQGVRVVRPKSSRILPTLAHRVRTSPIDKIVNDAILLWAREQRTLHRRKQDGVDVAVPGFTSIAPNILGAAKDTTGTSVRQLATSCRVVNWIGAMLRAQSLTQPLSVFLNSNAAKRQGLSCPFKRPTCSPNAPYRSIDGTCNNLRNPLWGSSFIPFARDLSPVYDTGRFGGIVRDDLTRYKGKNNVPLPNPRLVSNIVHSSSATPRETQVNMMYTNFGQSLSHDLTDTPMEGGFSGSKLNCCNTTLPTQRCRAIPIPDNDFFNKFNRPCMNFVRSAEMTDMLCRTGKREQLNIATAFVDGTQVYGKDNSESQSVRDKDGLLKTSFGNQCPFQQHPNKKGFEMGLNAFKAGDEKLSESTGLLAISLVWYREHNRIAKKLIEFPRFSILPDTIRDNVIFEEARKIVIAQMQQVVYKEYLPITIGSAAMFKHGLWPLTTGYYQGYNENINPTLTNAFATATMRFGHSMIRDEFSVLNENYAPTSPNLRLKDVFWRSIFYVLNENGFHRGTVTDKSEVCDRHMAVDIRNHMFQTKEGNGVDLATMNIQRGRDHGLPNYADYRRLVSLNVPTQWSRDPARGLRDMSQDTINKFQTVYASPEDIDLWSGGISETPIFGAQVGPLFAELIGREFARIRQGDRFWFENQSNGFRPDRLAEIRKTSMARVMCNNVVGIEFIQPQAFLAPTFGGENDRLTCSSLPEINLDLWR